MKTEKILSLIAAALIPSPLLLTSLSGTYGAVCTRFSLLWFLFGLSAMALGTAEGRWSLKAKGKIIYLVKLVTLLLGTLYAVLCVIVVYACQMNSFAYIFIPAALCLWYILGYRNGQGGALLNKMSLGGFCVESALLFPLCASVCSDSFVLLIIAALVMVLTMVVINYRQLERLSVRRKNEATVISAASKRFNLKLTLVFAALILVPFFFARWGGKWLWELVKIILLFLLSLFSFSAENIEIENEIGLAVPEVLPAGNNLWIQIVAAIIAAVGAVLLIKPLIRAVIKLIRRIGRAFGRSPDSVRKEDVYIDYYEESGREKASDTSFKKAYKAFRKEKDPHRRYRLGYKAFMMRLAELGAEPSPSDTTSVHRENCRETGAPEQTDSVIDKYERVRYKDEGVEMRDCEVMGEVLREMGKKR